MGRLLEKAPEARFQSAADLAWTLDRLDTMPLKAASGTHAIARSAAAPSGGRMLLSIAAIVAATVLGAWVMWPVTIPPAKVNAVQFTWPVPEGVTLGSEPAVSPDGRRIVFVGLDDSKSRLFVRDLASLEAVAITGTEGAKQPFWSPQERCRRFFRERPADESDAARRSGGRSRRGA